MKLMMVFPFFASVYEQVFAFQELILSVGTLLPYQLWGHGTRAPAASAESTFINRKFFSNFQLVKSGCPVGFNG